MKRSLPALALASAALVGCQSDAVGPRAATPRLDASTASAPSGGVIPGQYVVLFRRGRVLAGTLGGGGAGASASSAAALASASDQLAARKVAGARGVLRRTFGHVVQGFAAALSDSAVAALRADPDVALVEPDHVMHVADGHVADATTAGVEANAPWGLDRVDQLRLPLDGQYRYPGDGAGTSVYIIDTGINLTHAEFGGRAVTGQDFVTAGGTATDCHGHGTHVAGTVGGATYGVAKGVRLVAVRVLDCSGNGSESNVIAALDWVAQQKQAAPTVPAVANLSLGGEAAPALDEAVSRAAGAGVPVVVAAGNSAVDACSTSPARAADAITVGATDISDKYASFSNYGPCVDLAGPGVGIVSAYVGGTTATATLSGTSMATPHVAGVAALYLAANPSATSAQVAAALTTNASGGTITALPANTPSLLVNTAFLGGASTPGSPTATVMRSAVGTDLCAAVINESSTPGTGIVTWQCDGSLPARRFALASSGALTVEDGTRCIDAGGGQVGAGIAIAACTGAANQQWIRTTAGELVNDVAGRCLTVAYEDAQPGRALVLWPCNGGAAQRWAVAATGTAAPAAKIATSMTSALSSSLCAAVASESATPGTAVVTWRCDATLPARRFGLRSGALTVEDETRCLAVQGGQGTDGAAVVIAPCDGGPAQQWRATGSGQLVGLNNKCLTIAYEDAQLGRPLLLWPCNGGPAQQWTVASLN